MLANVKDVCINVNVIQLFCVIDGLVTSEFIYIHLDIAIVCLGFYIISEFDSNIEAVCFMHICGFMIVTFFSKIFLSSGHEIVPGLIFIIDIFII